MRGNLNASTISRREGRRTGPVAARSALSAHQKGVPRLERQRTSNQALFSCYLDHARPTSRPVSATRFTALRQHSVLTLSAGVTTGASSRRTTRAGVKGLQLEVMSVGDLHDPTTSVMTRLDAEVDVVQTSYSTVRWGGMCQLLPIISTSFSVDVLRGSPLAAKKALTFDDLRGLRIRMLRHANDATDQLRRVLKREEDIEVMDVQTFDFALFNEAAESGDVVITSGAWSGIHPGFIGIELDCPIEVPCFLAYPRNPAPHVQRFVDAYAEIIEEARA